MPWLAPPAVLERGLLTTLPPGATILRSGDRVQQVHVLVEGAINEIVGGLVIRHDEPGALIGAAGAVAERPSDSTLRTVTRAVLVSVVARHLLDLAEQPEVATWLAAELARRDAGVRRALAAVEGTTAPDGEMNQMGEGGLAPCGHNTHER